MRVILAFLILSVRYTGAALAQIYVANSVSGTVSVISDIPTVTVDIGTGGAGGPFGVAATPDGAFVYVANSFGTVSVIQTSDNTVVATTEVGDSPIGVAAGPMTSATTLVFVANSGSNNVTILEAAGEFGPRTFPVDVGMSPNYIATGDGGQ